MPERALCPQCTKPTVVVLDDVTVWSRVNLKDGRLQRGSIARTEKPLEAMGGRIEVSDDLLCTNGECQWMGRTADIEVVS